MAERCTKNLDEALISGYLDNELTQAAAQKVALHLEDCHHCRSLYEELRKLREVSMTTRFAEPSDEQWDERPKGSLSGGARGLGWFLLVAWLVLVTGYGLWTAWQTSQGLLERLLVFGGLSGAVLLFLSVLLDRMRSARSDRYREVQK